MDAVPAEPRADQALSGQELRGERLAGFIYGTILVLSVVIAGAQAYPHSPGRVAVLVAVTAFVFWLAHVYSFALGESVGHQKHLSAAELRHIGWREWTLVGAAVPPIAVLLLGAIGVLGESAAFWGALVVGLIVLAGQGVLFARIERLGPLGTLVVAAVNVGLGLLLIVLKVLVTHL
jgi:hypothetical protein